MEAEADTDTPEIASDDPALWANQPGIWRGIARRDHLAPNHVAPYLMDVPDNARDFTTDGFGNVYTDADAADEWHRIIADLSEQKLVTVLYLLADGDRTDRLYTFPRTPANSNIGQHLVFAPLVDELSRDTLTDVLAWIEASDDPDGDARTQRMFRQAVARHGPYDLRRDLLEQTRSGPYICPDGLQGDGQDWPENDDWYDPDADWLAPDAGQDTFKSHLLNHWTDSAHTQGGVVALECAAAMSLNPMYDTAEPFTYTAFGIRVPLRTPPGHVLERFDRVRRQTLERYTEQDTDTVTVFRGVPDGWTSAPLESWTTFREEAERYAGDDGEVLEREVPTEYVLFGHETAADDRWYPLAGHKGGAVVNNDGLKEVTVLGGSFL